MLLTTHLRKQGVFTKINEQVRFARRRFGRYDVIDFLAVLFGYVISGERTLEKFYQRLQPFAVPFMALFERDQLPILFILAMAKTRERKGKRRQIPTEEHGCIEKGPALFDASGLSIRTNLEN